MCIASIHQGECRIGQWGHTCYTCMCIASIDPIETGECRIDIPVMCA